MNWTFLAGAVYGCVLWGLLELLHSIKQRSKARAQGQATPVSEPAAEQAAAPAAAPEPRPEPGPDQRAPSSRWIALPGNRVLELGVTGYSIQLIAQPGRETYRLLDPEGDTVIWHSNLLALKAYAEHLAACRDEFVYRPG